MPHNADFQIYLINFSIASATLLLFKTFRFV